MNIKVRVSKASPAKLCIFSPVTGWPGLQAGRQSLGSAGVSRTVQTQASTPLGQGVMAHNIPAWHCAHTYKPDLIKISDTYHEITHPYLCELQSLQSTLSPDHLSTMSIYTPKFNLHRERYTQGAWAWYNAPEIMVGEGRVGCIPNSGGCGYISQECQGEPELPVGRVEQYWAGDQQRGSEEKWTELPEEGDVKSWA